jgi:hypothetical protein
MAVASLPVGPPWTIAILVACPLRAVRVRQAREKLLAGEAYTDRGFAYADELGQPCSLEAVTKNLYAGRTPAR